MFFVVPVVVGIVDINISYSLLIIMSLFFFYFIYISPYSNYYYTSINLFYILIRGVGDGVELLLLPQQNYLVIILH
jgi:hypothetical protein